MIKENNVRRVVIVVFVLLIAFFGYLVAKEAFRIGKLSSEISLIKQDIFSQQLNLKQLKELKKTEENLRQQYAAIKTLIPDTPLEEQIILRIQNSSVTHSALLASIRIGNQKKDGSLVEMPIEMSFNGTYKSFLSMLSGMIYGERLIRIDEVRLGQSDGNLTIDIKANTFYQIK